MSSEVTTIGPECFTDGTVICYKGENYTRQPQQVTTEAELEALPVGSIVLSRGRSWQRYNPRTIGLYEYHDWQCPDGGFVRDSFGLALLLPATVLHVGGES